MFGTPYLDANALSRISVMNEEGKTDQLKEQQQKDPKIRTFLDKDTTVEPTFGITGGILCHVRKSKAKMLVIPKTIVPQFLQAIDCDPTSGHMGRDKTLEKAQANRWCWNMRIDVLEFLKNCHKCKMFKTRTHKYKKMTSVKQAISTGSHELFYQIDGNGSVEII
ncbi:hypothetical protein INT47_005383 [Mucor saturninus]|uniref:Integrase zinc-binding domain-containing protein n=1 Tax=Mucor saturninus TaxID=64648 RepID=A0A8H7QGV8_9FUNG|nr:hypothetical protein INT47_005383 [Mucor saturninus]